MLNKLPQLQETLVLNSVNQYEAVDYINSYIDSYSCENLNIDISYMNVIDSCYVITLSASKHFIKYPNGKITWRISSELIKELNKDFELGNNQYIL